MNVTVSCQKFYTLREFHRRLRELGVDESDFAEKEGCVFCCKAEQNGVKGIACFF